MTIEVPVDYSDENCTITDSYVLVTNGRCYLAHTNVHKNGTIQLTIKKKEAASP